MRTMDNTSRNYKKAHASMVIAMFLMGSYHVITKVALNGGINQVVFCTYRNVIAFFILGPIAYFYEKKERPPVTWHLVLSFFFLGLTGIFGKQLLFVVGLGYTNATFATAMQPITPILTFLVTLVMGIESINFVKLEGKLKVVGIVLFAVGALVITLLRGPALLGSLNFELVHAAPPAPTMRWPMSSLMWSGLNRWHIGALSFLGNCICSSTYIILQGRILKKYPATISLTAYSYMFGVFLMVPTGLISSSNLTDWHLTWSEFLAVCYAGLVASALYYGLSTWSNKILGPALVSLYIPLEIVTAAFLSTIFLRSPIYLGSVIGAVLIVAGLYTVTWASHREREATLLRASNLPHVDGISEPLLHQDSANTTLLKRSVT